MWCHIKHFTSCLVLQNMWKHLKIYGVWNSEVLCFVTLFSKWSGFYRVVVFLHIIWPSRVVGQEFGSRLLWIIFFEEIGSRIRLSHILRLHTCDFTGYVGVLVLLGVSFGLFFFFFPLQLLHRYKLVMYGIKRLTLILCLCFSEWKKGDTVAGLQIQSKQQKYDLMVVII